MPGDRLFLSDGQSPLSDSEAFTVGHDEDPLPFMRRACFSRREEASRRREAHVPKLSQHGFKTEADMAGDVFEEDPTEMRPEFPGDPGNVGPEMAFILGPAALSGRAERLAGVSGKQCVEGSGERRCVEGGEVIPYGSGSEVSGLLGSDDDGSGVFLPFDKAPGVEAGFCEHEAHIQAAAACAEGEAVSGR